MKENLYLKHVSSSLAVMKILNFLHLKRIEFFATPELDGWDIVVSQYHSADLNYMVEATNE